MEVGALLVGEEEVGLPQALEHSRVHGERVRLEVLGQLEARVVPALPQEDVNPVVLETTRFRVNFINDTPLDTDNQSTVKCNQLQRETMVLLAVTGSTVCKKLDWLVLVWLAVYLG